MGLRARVCVCVRVCVCLRTSKFRVIDLILCQNFISTKKVFVSLHLEREREREREREGDGVGRER